MSQIRVSPSVAHLSLASSQKPVTESHHWAPRDFLSLGDDLAVWESLGDAFVPILGDLIDNLKNMKIPIFQLIGIIIYGLYVCIYIYLKPKNDPCFDWKRSIVLEGLSPKIEAPCVSP